MALFGRANFDASTGEGESLITKEGGRWEWVSLAVCGTAAGSSEGVGGITFIIGLKRQGGAPPTAAPPSTTMIALRRRSAVVQGIHLSNSHTLTRNCSSFGKFPDDKTARLLLPSSPSG